MDNLFATKFDRPCKGLDNIFAICEDAEVVMNILARKPLSEFGAIYSEAKTPLDAWYKVASNASWRNLVELRKTYPSADLVGRLTVFNIAGNKFRLITKVNYSVGATSGTIYIRAVLTHAEYDKGGWKNDPWF